MAKQNNQQSNKEFVVTQKRSLIACSHTQRATMKALGMRGRHKSVVIQDNPANRGQILKIQHLVEVAVQPAGTKVVVKSAPLKKTKTESTSARVKA